MPAFSNFSRGVADSVIKYGSTSYDGAKWHEVYNVNKLLPDRVRLTGVFGWNRENFSVIADGGRGNLLIRCKADKWSTMTVPGFTGFGQGLKPGRYLSLERLLLLNQKNSSECDLIVVTGDSYQVLGETHWATSLVPLADDLWYGFSRLGYVWRYNGTKVEDLERSSRDYYVRTKDNLVAQCHGQNMELGYVKSVTVLSPGRAVGLWSHPFGFAGIVTYHEGKWQLEQEVPMNGSPKSAWFLDEKNLVAIGGDKLVRILAGKPEFQVLSISGHEYPSKALTHVWGKSMYDYCVADKRGNILNFNGDTWRLVIRGPNEADDRENFQVAWVSPEGAVFAFTEKAVYCLE